MLYEIKCTYEGTNTKGEPKQLTEAYLYHAELVSECETRMLEEIPDCRVISVVESKIMEIVNENVTSGDYYKAKVTETSVDDKGNESKKSYTVLCNALNLIEATEIFQEYLKQGLEDMTLDGVNKTRFIAIL